jgi:hypothetical protein
MANSINGDVGYVAAALFARPILPANQAKSAAPAPSAAPTGDSPSYGYRLQVDDRTKEVVVMITDPVTRAVVQEIPSQEMRTAAHVIRNLIGPLLDKVA